MPWWVMLFADGTLLYIGAVLACTGLTIRVYANGRISGIIGNSLAMLGAIGAGLSAAPLAWWVYAVWALAWFAAMFAAKKPSLAQRRRVAGLALFAGISVAVCGAEVRHSILAHLAVPTNAVALYVVGDSLSIGAQKQELNWPELLGARLGLPVKKYSFAGAKAGTSLEDAKQVGPEPALVLLEIGGNDLFAETQPKQFADDLRALLETIRFPGHTLLMLELPLPPTFNRYGQIQRALAKEFGVTLIPKRVLGGTFSVPEATEDGVHFTATGHAALAERLARLFGK